MIRSCSGVRDGEGCVRKRRPNDDDSRQKRSRVVQSLAYVRPAIPVAFCHAQSCARRLVEGFERRLARIPSCLRTVWTSCESRASDRIDRSFECNVAMVARTPSHMHESRLSRRERLRLFIVNGARRPASHAVSVSFWRPYTASEALHAAGARRAAIPLCELTCNNLFCDSGRQQINDDAPCSENIRCRLIARRVVLHPWAP